MQSNGKVMVFVILLTLVCGGVITLLFTSLKDIHDKNELLFNKKAILTSVQGFLDAPVKELSEEQIEDIFSNEIEQVVINRDGELLDEAVVQAFYPKGGRAENIDMAKEEKKDEDDQMLPIFVFNDDDGEKYYICAVRGNGLWDKIWGNIAIGDDFNTIVGASFDHKGETPGLGAEIKDDKNFPAQFAGKKLRDDLGEYKSVSVIKSGASEDNIDHEVDGITGATITCDGVTDMMIKWMKYYDPYFEAIGN